MSQANIPLDQDYWDEPQEPVAQGEPDSISVTQVDESTCAVPSTQESAVVSSPETLELTQLVQTLQERNTFLLERVAQLEIALNDCQTRLQTQNLTIIQEHVARLTHELESSHQIAQRQQQLIETITNHLNQNQEQVTLLEQECELLRQQHREQTEVLSQSETTCTDLRARLDRQQRFTLQLKAALVRCLEKLDAQSPKTDKAKARAEGQAPAKPSGETSSVQPSLLDEPAFDETTFNQEAPLESTLLDQNPKPVEEPVSIAPPGESVAADPSETSPDASTASIPSLNSPSPAFTIPPILSEPEPSLVGSTAATGQEAEGVSPSPLVYPTRSSQKKLKSLAAVDLPSFPRRAEG